MSALTGRPWVLASSNPGKIAELLAILAPLGVELRSQSALGIPDADEPHATFVENALAKARQASRLTGLPGLADDSGLCVPALGGAPGVHSARYAALDDARLPALGREAMDAANNRKLVAAVAALGGGEAASAWYYCSIVLVAHADDPCPVIAEGVWRGSVVATPAGGGGFGYDPHFLVAHEGLTAAQLTAERKNAISHRARALKRLVEALDGR
jgi:XTP/dITP diphosphohydrolase